MSRKFVVGNWKMNGSTAQVRSVLDSIRREAVAADVAVCLPYPYLALAISQLAASPIRVGAQDVSQFRDGAFTGEVSAGMLKDVGCALGIVGHSERRQLLGESNALVADKLGRLLDAGLFGIFCVGETLAERDAGRAEAKIEEQLSALRALCERGAGAAQFCIAYEPVWAIGTGRVASAEQIGAMHELIKHYLGASFAVLYGGSVKAGNAADLMALPVVDGVLVGGASLSAEEFSGICRAAG